MLRCCRQMRYTILSTLALLFLLTATVPTCTLPPLLLASLGGILLNLSSQKSGISTERTQERARARERGREHARERGEEAAAEAAAAIAKVRPAYHLDAVALLAIPLLLWLCIIFLFLQLGCQEPVFSLHPSSPLAHYCFNLDHVLQFPSPCHCQRFL